MAPDTLCLGVWTIGDHARRNLLPAVTEAPSWRLGAISTRDPAVCAEVAEACGTAGYLNPDDMLNDGALDAVLLAGPNGTHFERARQALLAGKHVFVEKSLTGRLGQAEELLALAMSRDLVLAECFMYQFHPQFEVLQNLLGPDGPVGRMHSIEARFGFPHLAADNIRYSRALQGGALLDAGAYCLSALDTLTGGDGEVVWARVGREHPFEVDTFGSAILSRGGTTAFADWGFGRSYRNELEVWGADASVSVPRSFSKPASLATEILVRHQAGGRLETITVPGANAFVRMLEHFAQACDSSALRRELWRRADRQARVVDAVRSRGGEPD
jgi:predicted dehydrogenase